MDISIFKVRQWTRPLMTGKFPFIRHTSPNQQQSRPSADQPHSRVYHGRINKGASRAACTEGRNSTWSTAGILHLMFDRISLGRKLLAPAHLGKQLTEWSSEGTVKPIRIVRRFRLRIYSIMDGPRIVKVKKRTKLETRNTEERRKLVALDG